MSDDPVLIDPVRLEATISGVLEALGVAHESAGAVASLLVEADLTGVDSHGCHLLSMYVRRLTSGEIIPNASIDMIRDDGSTVWLDAHLGLGQIAGLRAVDLAVERSGDYGISTVCVREATHLGALGVLTRRVADQHKVAFCFQNGPTIVPPLGGITPLFSTNPISYAIPTNKEPRIVYDIATTAVAGNKLLLAKKRGDATIPEGWANDERGRPTTDTNSASVWNLQWFGGHKGYGLGLLVELLAGVLSGSSFGTAEFTSSPITGRERVAKGFTLLALDPERFIGRDEFERRVDRLIAEIHSSEPAEGMERIWLPGEQEHYRRIERERHGIPLSDAIVDELDQFASDYGAPLLRR